MSSILLLPVGIAAVVVAISASVFCRKDPAFPSALIDELVQNRKGKHVPLNKMTVIVTGSTNGLGKMIASKLYEMGTTVIIASRSAAKSQAVIIEIQAKYPDSIGKLEVGIIDTSDMTSVVSFVRTFQEGHKELHALINNAGIHYVSVEGNPLSNLSLPMTSPQGYDLAFATNYLGHFLLTELLLPILSKTSDFGTVINIASSYHFLGSGEMLRPNTIGGDKSPVAACSVINNYKHRELAYGNNKLAQVLHAKELQRRISASGQRVRTVAICPGWVDTGMLPDNLGGKFVGRLAFKVEEGILSTMCGLFDSSLKGGEFVGNSFNIWARQPFLFMAADQLRIKGPICSFIAMYLLFFQKLSYGKCYVEVSSPDSMDENLSKALYDWSKAEIAQYL